MRFYKSLLTAYITLVVSMNELGLASAQNTINSSTTSPLKNVAVEESQTTSATSIASTSIITTPSTTSTTTFITTPKPEAKGCMDEDDEDAFAADLSVLLPSNYVPYRLPVTDNSQFIPVFVSLFITSVTDVNEKEGQIVLDTQYSKRWLDYKISKRASGKRKNVTLGAKALESVWSPDLYFDGTSPLEKDAADATQKTVKVLFNTNDLRDAQVALSERIRMKLDCSMEFHYYPADTQVCTYNLRSFSYKQNRLKLFWETPNSVFLSDPTHPNFDLLVESIWPNIEINKTNKLFVEETFNPFRKGNYSALTFTIKARRKLSYHLVQTYLPSVLLILMTWLCFLLPTSMVEARIAISMTTVLTLTAMFSAVREQAPSVSYSMAIDVWMVFCIFVVFVSLLLFTFVYWMKNKAEREKENNAENSSVTSQKKYNLVLYCTKYYGFYVFALSFFLFILFYWLWLLTFSNYFGWNPSAKFNAKVDDEDADSEYFHFYRYLIEEADTFFNIQLYAPAARDTLKRVFGLVK